MSSLKMTFSLTSLIFLIALGLVFVPMSVMAADGGPTVTITEYTGNNGTGVKHVQTRGAFWVKVAFSHVVGGFTPNDPTDFNARKAPSRTTPLSSSLTTAEVAGGTAATNVPPSELTANQVFVVTVNMDDTDFDAGYLSIIVPENAVLGTSGANLLGNQMGSFETTNFAKFTKWTVSLALDESTLKAADDLNEGKLKATGAFTVNFTLNPAVGATPSIPFTQLRITDTAGKDLSSRFTANTPDADGDGNIDFSGVNGTVIYTVGTGDDIASVMLSVNPQYMAANTITVPKPGPGPTPKPTVTLSKQGDIDTAMKTFRVRLEFSEAVGTLAASNVKVFKAKADGTISTTAADVAEPTVTKLGGGMIWIAEVNYEFETLPLFVTIPSSVASAMTPAGGLPVGGGVTPPQPGTPAKPDAPTAVKNATDDLRIDITWTAPADNGSPITGYTVRKYEGATLVETFPDPVTGLPAIGTNLNLSVGHNASVRGKSFTFTVMATNANGDSAESDKSDAVKIPAAPPVVDDRDPVAWLVIDSVRHVRIPANSGTQHWINNDGSIDFLAWFSEPMHPGPSASRVDKDDFTIKVTNESGVAIPFTWSLGDAQKGRQAASTGLPGEFREYYWFTVTPDVLPTIPTGYEQPPLEVEVTLNKANVQSARNEPLRETQTITFDTIPPKVTITPGYSDAGGANFVPASTGEPKGKLAFKFEFSESLSPSFSTTDIHRSVGADNFELLQDSGPFEIVDGTTYIVVATVIDENAPTTVLIKKEEVSDWARNRSRTDTRATYTPTTQRPVVTIKATDPFNCGVTGNRVIVTISDSEGLKVGETITADEITVSKGWQIATRALPAFSATKAVAGDTSVSATFYVIRNDVENANDRSWLGIQEVKITVAADAVMDDTEQGNLVYPDPANKEHKQYYVAGPVLTIPANSYIVVVREQAAGRTHLNHVPTLYVGDPRVGSVGVSVLTWDCMPDLGVLLGRTNHTYADNRGGTLVVGGGGGLMTMQSRKHVADPNVKGSEEIKKGTVGITEIMWAIDRSDYFGLTRNFEHAREQWIELHNLNNFEVKVTLFDLVRDEAYSYNDYGDDEIDRMTNFNLPQYHGSWPIRDASRGQDGDSDYGEDFVAMQRGPATVAKNYNHGDFDGRNGGKWTQATAVYLTRQAQLAGTGQLAFENLNYDFIGTPGRSNAIGPTGPTVATPVPLKPFVINEVGNRDNRLYDWIELRNTSGAEANLRNYNISIVTGVDSDASLFNFPNSDIRLADNEVILVLASDPEDDGEHPIAVGHDVLGGTDQVLGLGENPAKYIVATSNDGLYTAGLPASNFVLILRHTEGVDIAKPETYNGSHDKANSAKAKIGTHERIVDIAGYHNSLGNRNAAPKYTALWPLIGHGAPFSKNDLKSEGVYFRRDAGRIHGENNNDKPAFVSQGYTGVGYRRSASNSAVHGGTPGYNDIRKNLVADVKSGDDSTGIVTISEIMFDQGDGRYPQWIELYNSSPTNAVNLHSEAGWRLEIRNFDDNEIPFDRLSGTLNFKDSEVQTILPQQTVLIASTRARNIGSDTTNASVVFIPTRVFSVWSEKPARDALGMTRATDPILSEVAFYLELIDGKGNLSDAAGNLTRRRARGDDAYWEWSDVQGEAEMDARSSVIRRYREPEMGVRPERWERYTDDEILDMGIEAAGWVSAAKTEFRRVARTWYGHDDDYGTPGTTKGKPLPVSLSKFRPERMKDTGEIVVRWITESELNNAGFNILRSETRNGEFTKVHFVAGKGTTSERSTYEWKDTTAKPNVVYYYQIQDISLDGEVTTLRQSRLKGNVTAAGKATTTWGEIKALQ